MRINEVLKKSQISDEFKNAVADWQEMWQPTEAAKIILASPEARPFMQPPSLTKIYRSVRKLYKPSKDAVVAYAANWQGAANFAESFNVNGKWFMIEKKFNPNDFLLDFTRMIQHYGLVGPKDENEYELWMKPTPYYTTGTEEEVYMRFATYG